MLCPINELRGARWGSAWDAGAQFIADEGHDRLIEVDLRDNASIEIIHASVKEAGIEIDEELILFHDDEDPVECTGYSLPP